MKKGLLITFALLLLIAMACLIIALRTPPIVQVRVVDPAGKPIKDAIIKPYALRGSDGGHYGWSTNFAIHSKEVRSNEKGLARVEYPTYLIEGIRCTEVTFTIEHPNYSSDDPSVAVPAPLPSTAPLIEKFNHMRLRLNKKGPAQDIKLRPGAVLILSGHISGAATPVEKIFAIASTSSGVFRENFWHRDGPRLLTGQMPPGSLFLQLVHRGPDGTNYFSEVQLMSIKSGETNQLDLSLRPGIQISGRLDDNVPRPIRNGLVSLRTIKLREKDINPLMWSDYQEVNADGTFQFKAVPPGRIEILVLCDGFISKNPTNAFRITQPQVYNLTKSAELNIEMEPTGTAQVRVLDPDGKPLPNAQVSFWPNERWAEWSAWVLGTSFYRTADILQDSRDDSWRHISRSIRDFRATTDSNGLAQINEIPSGAEGFSVSHNDYVLPINKDRRTDQITIIAARTNYATAKLQHKGKDLLE
jgi:hypothetical protein